MADFVEVPIIIGKRGYSFASEDSFKNLFFIYEFLDEHDDEILVEIDGECPNGHFINVQPITIPKGYNSILVHCRDCESPMARIRNIADPHQEYKLEMYKEYF